MVLQDSLYILTGLYNTFSASADFCHVHAGINHLPGKIFDVSKASLVLIAMGLLDKIWGHFLFVMFKEN